MRIAPPVPIVTTSLRAVAAAVLVMSIRVILAVWIRPRPLKVTPAGNPVPDEIAVLNWVVGAGEGMTAMLMPTRALAVPSLPVRPCMVAGQSVVAVTQPTFHVTKPVALVKPNRTLALRLTASDRANCKPFRMDSAAVRFCVFCIHRLNAGKPAESRMAIMTSPIISSIRETPSCLDVRISTRPPSG